MRRLADPESTLDASYKWLSEKAPDAQLDQWAITIRYEDENPDDEPDRQPAPHRMARRNHRRLLGD